MARLGDDERWPCAQDLKSLTEDHLDAAWIGFAGKLSRTLGWLDVGEVDDATLDLRDRLLGDDEDVVLVEARAACSRLDEDRGEIVSLLELRDPEERDHAQLPAQGSPVTRIPAWPL